MCTGLTLKAAAFIQKKKKEKKKANRGGIHMLSKITDFLKVPSSHSLFTLINL